MLSLTQNAPIEAFIESNGLFKDVGIDGVYFHLHKAYEFMGMSALPTFICNDVMKNSQVEIDEDWFQSDISKIIRHI